MGKGKTIKHGMAKVLVVDDAMEAREIGKYILRHYNFDIEEARNGVEAWALIVKEKPDAILLDLEMPQMDGYEVLQELEKESFSIPVLVMTGNTSIYTQQLCESLGAIAFFTKPINVKQFHSVVQDLRKLRVITS